MASTQKTVMLILLFNIILTVAATAVQGDYGPVQDRINGLVQQMKEKQSQQTEDTWLLRQASNAVTGFFGQVVDAIAIVAMFLFIFIKGLMPLGLLGMPGASLIESMIFAIIELVRVILYIMAGIEAYMLFQNRKTSS